jgi:hypothetical protein
MPLPNRAEQTNEHLFLGLELHDFLLTEGSQPPHPTPARTAVAASVAHDRGPGSADMECDRESLDMADPQIDISFTALRSMPGTSLMGI